MRLSSLAPTASPLEHRVTDAELQELRDVCTRVAATDPELAEPARAIMDISDKMTAMMAEIRQFLDR